MVEQTSVPEIFDNLTRGKAEDSLRKYLTTDTYFSIASAFSTSYAFAALPNKLEAIHSPAGDKPS